MKLSLVPGLTAVNRVVVRKAKTSGSMGEGDLPHLVAEIETTCRNVILAHADANEDNVGISVTIKYLAPTLPGVNVEIIVEIITIRGRQVTFAVNVKDEVDIVIYGTHARFVVDKAKTVERLKAKADRLAARRV
jgi:fluoroacetyl-CoA thioesterase